MRFTSQVDVPEGTKENIQEQNLRNRRRLADNLPPEASLIEVFAVKEDLDEDEDLSMPLMDGWELVSFGSDGIEVRLNFVNPIMMS